LACFVPALFQIIAAAPNRQRAANRKWGLSRPISTAACAADARYCKSVLDEKRISPHRQESETLATGAKDAMVDDWDFYFLQVDDKPASIYLNLGLAPIAPLTGQTHMAYVRIAMHQPRPDGLSSQEEYDALIGLEDALVQPLEQRGHIYAGRNTSDGNRDFYFYTADPESFQEAACAAMAGHRQYRFQVGSRRDPDWEIYRNFLYPSPGDLQGILDRREIRMNRNVIEQLVSEGDDPSKSRAIDHLAYLPNASAAESLRAYLSNEGFTVSEPRAAGDVLALPFERQDVPNNIDEVVLPIVRRVRKLGGNYDGWGCEVTP